MIGKKEKGLIRPPGRRLLRFLPLRFANKQNHGGKRQGYADLNLTSMVDMLTILVVFLLQTFSASGELFRVSKDIKLPESSQYQTLVQAPLITISKEAGVALDGKGYASPEQLRTRNFKDYKIQDLYDDLVAIRNRTKDKSKFKGQIFFQVDQDVDFEMIKRVLYTCTQAGFTNINPLVTPTG